MQEAFSTIRGHVEHDCLQQVWPWRKKIYTHVAETTYEFTSWRDVNNVFTWGNTSWLEGDSASPDVFDDLSLVKIRFESELEFEDKATKADYEAKMEAFKAENLR